MQENKQEVTKFVSLVKIAENLPSVFIHLNSNTVDPDKMLQMAIFDQGLLHLLLNYIETGSILKKKSGERMCTILVNSLED